MSVDVEERLRRYARALDVAAPAVTAAEVMDRSATRELDGDPPAWSDDVPLAASTGRLRERVLAVVAVAAAAVRRE